MSFRDDLIERAVRFLNSDAARNAGELDTRAFLLNNLHLTPEELEWAYTRAGNMSAMSPTRAAASLSALAQTAAELPADRQPRHTGTSPIATDIAPTSTAVGQRGDDSSATAPASSRIAIIATALRYAALGATAGYVWRKYQLGDKIRDALADGQQPQQPQVGYPTAAYTSLPPGSQPFAVSMANYSASPQIGQAHSNFISPTPYGSSNQLNQIGGQMSSLGMNVGTPSLPQQQSVQPPPTNGPGGGPGLPADWYTRATMPAAYQPQQTQQQHVVGQLDPRALLQEHAQFRDAVEDIRQMERNTAASVAELRALCRDVSTTLQASVHQVADVSKSMLEASTASASVAREAAYAISEARAVLDNTSSATAANHFGNGSALRHSNSNSSPTNNNNSSSKGISIASLANEVMELRRELQLIGGGDITAIALGRAGGGGGLNNGHHLVGSASSGGVGGRSSLSPSSSQVLGSWSISGVETGPMLGRSQLGDGGAAGFNHGSQVGTGNGLGSSSRFLGGNSMHNTNAASNALPPSPIPAAGRSQGSSSAAQVDHHPFDNSNNSSGRGHGATPAPPAAVAVAESAADPTTASLLQFIATACAHVASCNSDAAIATAIPSIVMVLSNLLANPTVPRYRRIPASNHMFQRTIACVAGYEGLLGSLGFRVVGDGGGSSGVYSNLNSSGGGGSNAVWKWCPFDEFKPQHQEHAGPESAASTSPVSNAHANLIIASGAADATAGSTGGHFHLATDVCLEPSLSVLRQATGIVQRMKSAHQHLNQQQHQQQQEEAAVVQGQLQLESSAAAATAGMKSAAANVEDSAGVQQAQAQHAASAVAPTAPTATTTAATSTPPLAASISGKAGGGGGGGTRPPAPTLVHALVQASGPGPGPGPGSAGGMPGSSTGGHGGVGTAFSGSRPRAGSTLSHSRSAAGASNAASSRSAGVGPSSLAAGAVGSTPRHRSRSRGGSMAAVNDAVSAAGAIAAHDGASNRPSAATNSTVINGSSAYKSQRPEGAASAISLADLDTHTSPLSAAALADADGDAAGAVVGHPLKPSLLDAGVASGLALMTTATINAASALPLPPSVTTASSSTSAALVSSPRPFKAAAGATGTGESNALGGFASGERGLAWDTGASTAAPSSASAATTGIATAAMAGLSTPPPHMGDGYNDHDHHTAHAAAAAEGPGFDAPQHQAPASPPSLLYDPYSSALASGTWIAASFSSPATATASSLSYRPFQYRMKGGGGAGGAGAGGAASLFASPDIVMRNISSTAPATASNVAAIPTTPTPSVGHDAGLVPPTPTPAAAAVESQLLQSLASSSSFSELQGQDLLEQQQLHDSGPNVMMMSSPPTSVVMASPVHDLRSATVSPLPVAPPVPLSLLLSPVRTFVSGAEGGAAGEAVAAVDGVDGVSEHAARRSAIKPDAGVGDDAGRLAASSSSFNADTPSRRLVSASASERYHSQTHINTTASELMNASFASAIRSPLPATPTSDDGSDGGVEAGDAGGGDDNAAADGDGGSPIVDDGNDGNGDADVGGGPPATSTSPFTREDEIDALLQGHAHSLTAASADGGSHGKPSPRPSSSSSPSVPATREPRSPPLTTLQQYRGAFAAAAAVGDAIINSSQLDVSAIDAAVAARLFSPDTASAAGGGDDGDGAVDDEDLNNDDGINDGNDDLSGILHHHHYGGGADDAAPSPDQRLAFVDDTDTSQDRSGHHDHHQQHLLNASSASWQPQRVPSMPLELSDDGGYLLSSSPGTDGLPTLTRGSSSIAAGGVSTVFTSQPYRASLPSTASAATASSSCTSAAAATVAVTARKSKSTGRHPQPRLSATPAQIRELNSVLGMSMLGGLTPPPQAQPQAQTLQPSHTSGGGGGQRKLDGAAEAGSSEVRPAVDSADAASVDIVDASVLLNASSASAWYNVNGDRGDRDHHSSNEPSPTSSSFTATSHQQLQQQQQQHLTYQQVIEFVSSDRTDLLPGLPSAEDVAAMDVISSMVVVEAHNTVAGAGIGGVDDYGDGGDVAAAVEEGDQGADGSGSGGDRQRHPSSTAALWVAKAAPPKPWERSSANISAAAGSDVPASSGSTPSNAAGVVAAAPPWLQLLGHGSSATGDATAAPAAPHDGDDHLQQPPPTLVLLTMADDAAASDAAPSQRSHPGSGPLASSDSVASAQQTLSATTPKTTANGRRPSHSNAKRSAATTPGTAGAGTGGTTASSSSTSSSPFVSTPYLPPSGVAASPAFPVGRGGR